MAGDLTEQTARAEAWLAGQKWKLREYIDFRPRVQTQRLERFLVDVPRELLQGLVAHLVATATETDIQLEGKPFEGTWTFTRHTWERQQGGDDHRLVFVQALMSGTGHSADYEVENGCAYKVTQKFYWDVATVGAAPAGSSGVGYRIGGVSRDRTSGLFSYYLETRERMMQKIEAYTARAAADGTVSRRHWRGVRNGDVDENGNPAGIQSMSAVPDGSYLELRRSKNEDCTQDVDQDETIGIDNQTTDGEVRAGSETEVTRHTLADAQESAERSTSEKEAGAIVRVDNRPTPYKNRWSTERTVTVPEKALETFEVGTTRVTEFANHTPEEIAALFSNTDVVPAGYGSRLSLGGTPYKVEVGEESYWLWDGTLTAIPSVWRRREKWEEFEETGLTESTYVLREYQGAMYKIVQTITFDYVGGYDIETGLAAYKAKNPKDGSFFKHHDSENYYVYKAVTDVQVQATDVTSAFEGGTQFTI